MQPKKNEKVDLTKNSSLYFVIGLSFILFVSWQAIEWKTYKKTYGYEALNVEDDDSSIVDHDAINWHVNCNTLSVECDDFTTNKIRFKHLSVKNVVGEDSS